VFPYPQLLSIIWASVFNIDLVLDALSWALATSGTSSLCVPKALDLDYRCNPDIGLHGVPEGGKFYGDRADFVYFRLDFLPIDVLVDAQFEDLSPEAKHNRSVCFRGSVLARVRPVLGLKHGTLSQSRFWLHSGFVIKNRW